MDVFKSMNVVFEKMKFYRIRDRNGNPFCEERAKRLQWIARPKGECPNIFSIKPHPKLHWALTNFTFE
jgi:hypothetical protein